VPASGVALHDVEALAAYWTLQPVNVDRRGASVDELDVVVRVGRAAVAAAGEHLAEDDGRRGGGRGGRREREQRGREDEQDDPEHGQLRRRGSTGRRP